MAEKVKRILTGDVSLAFDATGDFTQQVPPLIFEMDDRKDAEELTYGAVRIRQYPHDYGVTNVIGTPLFPSLFYRTTEGQVFSTGEVRSRTVREKVVVAGATEVTLRYPVFSGLSFAVDGDAYDARGNPLSGLSLAFDSKKNALVTSKPFFGVVTYEYVTSYRILRYFPNISLLTEFEMYYLPDPKDYGAMIAVPASLPFSMDPVVFQVQPPQPMESEFELYRVESTSVVTSEGEYEMPMGWKNTPPDGSYPDKTQGGADLYTALSASDSYLNVSRVHEVAYITLRNKDRQANYADSERLPLNYAKALTQRDLTATKVDAYYDNVQKLQAESILMRRQKNLIPIARPYDSAANVAASRTVTVLSISEGNGNRTKVTKSDQYKIKLTPKASSKPNITNLPQRREPGDEDRSVLRQAMILNGYIARLWEAVDWLRLRRQLEASYDPEVYQFDWTGWPTN